MPAVIVVFDGESEFPLSLIEELGHSRILRSLYFIGLRNQRVKAAVVKDKWTPYRAYLLAISQPHLPSKDANRLRPAFSSVKGNFLDRLSRC
ncbi:hypothetical protein AVEN_241361-1 [Araneus ventricosus]|uniref:Uncharacterized protein n=1 Tax=Araneus ventricosus TaxID=182803 RepID=A0A4Y2IDX9_ARAVE|nr:hypothetical protein AVEN_241361-1 [Araneus ventricosus]